ncbi:hypothetical protein HNQ44_001408 [Planomicrobium koreense]|uniref:Uncharacterized protein n=1 Tax=Planococcus koreensis TaxID=112331 RepID=A0A7W8CSE4_9BACL|nr:hypothetical protein [Planococcus koreensis]MBB5179984.1 hypothetical protein [Planococcus koreensis]
MPTIYTAIFRNNNKEEEIDLFALTPEKYYKTYKSNLFCSEVNCFAKLCYVVMPGDKKRSYLRKWRNSPHSENCIHYTEEVKDGTRKRRSGTTLAIASEDQIRRSLKQGFELELLSDEEREKRKEENRRKRNKRIRRNSGINKSEQLSIVLVTNPEEATQVLNEVKGGRLVKRNVDALTNGDLWNTRTIIGYFYDLEHSKERTIVRVVKNGSFLDIKFEEAFFAAMPEYQGMFHLIERFAKENDRIIIIATGEVRRNEEKKEFSVSVFDKNGLSVHGKRLVDLAREYALGHFNF